MTQPFGSEKIFDFHGVRGRFYNILSDASGLEVDSYFSKVPGIAKDTTVSSQIRVKAPKLIKRLSVQLIRTSKSTSGNILNVQLNVNTPVNVTSKSKTTTVKLSPTTRVVWGSKKGIPQVEVTVPSLKILITLRAKSGGFSNGIGLYLTRTNIPLKAPVKGVLGVSYVPPGGRDAVVGDFFAGFDG